jgi:hypothetical protein
VSGTAQELLRQLSEMGAALIPAGQKLIIRAGTRPVPGELVRIIRDRKTELLAVLDEAAAWQARHAEALTHWRALHSDHEAADLAWLEMQNGWHALHGERLPQWQCAGCGEAIGGRPVLPLGDGNRVHLDTLDCVIAYGERWRDAATRALAAMRLPPPAGAAGPND